MKNLIVTLLVLIVGHAFGQEVKYKVTNADPVTGKKMLVYLTAAPLRGDGAPSHINYLVKLKEVNESTDAIPAATDERSVKAVASYEDRFEITDRKISSTTLLYLPDSTVDVNAISMRTFFATKIINTFPGVQGGDQAWKFAEGLL